MICSAVMDLINPNLHVSRSMAEVFAIDDARGRVNKKCVVSSVVILDNHTCIYIIRSNKYLPLTHYNNEMFHFILPTYQQMS